MSTIGRAGTELETLATSAIRVLAMDAVQKANSGHPGLPMGCAEIAYVLFTSVLEYDPKDPAWPDRDRFVLSAGHGSMLLYVMLHLAGYDLSLSDLESFRQLGSKTPGHPEYGETPGVETTTGPLGQGLGNAVGMALAESILAARYNTPQHTIVQHRTYALVSDGDLMEGISHEAASLAGHLGLGKLIALYDDNRISLDGPTRFSFSEDVEMRFRAYGWHVQRVDGHDVGAVEKALGAAREELARPSLIICRTVIGKGSPNKAGTSAVHGAPLGPEEVAETRKCLGWTLPPFVVPDEVRARFADGSRRAAKRHEAWKRTFADWCAANPGLAAEWKRVHVRKLPEGWEGKLPRWSPEEKPIATRVASGKAINALAETLPELIGGSADLASSNNTLVLGKPAYAPDARGGRNLWFGVREHAMGAVLNGMSLHGGLRPYGATFLTFSDYCRASIRLAALMRQPVVYVFTHDSIFVGEDGPTHQPVEHIAALRTIPHLRTIRPADANETAAAWALALRRTDGPTALILTRQNLPHLEATALGKGTERGGYVLVKETGPAPEIILIGTGSETHLAIAAAKALEEKGVSTRVVNLPCQELFDEQPDAYRRSVLPPEVTLRLAIEVAVELGWHKYVGTGGRVICMRTFGASGPQNDLAEHFGFTVEKVVATALELMGRS
jgi:transketolase